MNRNKFLLNKIYKIAQSMDVTTIKTYNERKENIIKFLEDFALKSSLEDKNLSQTLEGIKNNLIQLSAGFPGETEEKSIISNLRMLESVLSSTFSTQLKNTSEFKNLKAQVDYLFFSAPKSTPVPSPVPSPTPDPKKLSPEQYAYNLMGAVNAKANKYKNQYGSKDNPYITDETKAEFNDLDRNIIKELDRIYNTTTNMNLKEKIKQTFKNLKDNVSSEITAAMPNLHFSSVDASSTNYIKSNEPEELSWEDFTGQNTLQVGKNK